MRGARIGLILMLIPAALAAQSALTVDFNALWRVDLNSHEAELIAELGTPGEMISCNSLTSSTSGQLRCRRGNDLYAVRSDTLELLSTLPGSSTAGGLAFDDLDRLWFVSSRDPVLWRLDPDTGAVLDSVPLTLEGSRHHALAAYGQRLFVFTRNPYPSTTWLEEIDTESGVSLSARDLGSVFPFDAAFDPSGNLWFSDSHGEIILGVVCLSYNRLDLDSLTSTQTWYDCLNFYEEPFYVNIAVVQETPVVDVPALSPLGMLLSILAISLAAWRVLRRNR